MRQLHIEQLWRVKSKNDTQVYLNNKVTIKIIHIAAIHGNVNEVLEGQCGVALVARAELWGAIIPQQRKRFYAFSSKPCGLAKAPSG